MMLPWVLGVALLSMGVVYVMIKLHPWRLGYRLLVILLVLGIAVKTDSAPSSHVSFLLGGGAYSVLYKPDPSLRIYPHLSHSNSDANRMVLTIPLINVIWRATGLTTAAQIEDKLRLCGGDDFPCPIAGAAKAVTSLDGPLGSSERLQDHSHRDL
jgi:hypothetical protein